MKKIVALVLAMVMVLGLATTAFAVKGGNSFAGAVNDKGWKYDVTVDDAEDEKDQTFTTYEIEAIALKDGATCNWGASLGTVEEDDDFAVVVNGYETFVKLASGTHANFVLVDGKNIEYYIAVDGEMEYEGKAVKVELPVLPLDNADEKCNTLYADSALTTTYYYYDYVLYREYVLGQDSWADVVVLNVDGKAFFGIATKADNGDGYTYTGHTYQVETSNVTHNTGFPTVTKVYCEDCLATFKFVQAPATVANSVFGDDNYQQIVDAQGVGLFGGFLYTELVTPAIPGVSAALNGSATVAPEAGDKVESAETFDAGIAMYVGMSVMAAAGSAVVLKKKD